VFTPKKALPSLTTKKVASRKGKEQATVPESYATDHGDANDVPAVSDDFETKLLKLILDDNDLHLRILRYEVFVLLVILCAVLLEFRIGYSL
jgi:hypothetical protein